MESSIEAGTDRCRVARRCLFGVVGVVAALGLGIAAPTLAEERAASAAEDAAPSPAVDLDSLLKLPDSYSSPAQNRGGASPDEWRERYRKLRTERAEAEAAIERAQEELDSTVAESGAYSVSALGSNPNDQPVSFKLRQEIRRQKETIERADREIRALDIEADLAGIPPEWRE